MFGSSAMAGTVLMEDTFSPHFFTKVGSNRYLISGGNEYVQLSSYKGSDGSARTDNNEDRAKALCEQKGLDYTYKMLDADFTAEEMFERAPNAKTFPQIFIDGKSIGGYQQLEEQLNV